MERECPNVIDRITHRCGSLLSSSVVVMSSSDHLPYSIFPHSTNTATDGMNGPERPEPRENSVRTRE